MPPTTMGAKDFQFVASLVKFVTSWSTWAWLEVSAGRPSADGGGRSRMLLCSASAPFPPNRREDVAEPGGSDIVCAPNHPLRKGVRLNRDCRQVFEKVL